MLAQEYTFTSQHTPRLGQALSLEDAAVKEKEVYQRSYTQPLQTIYSPKIPLREHLRWLWAGLVRWLEGLSPFWIAFALTLAETVGATILVLPIALAGFGPLAGVVLLLVLGLINILIIRLLLTNMARQTGAVAQARQLTAALQQSRQQLVTAREEERRRLRRDLHDGLGPQLASQTLTLNAIGKLLERDPIKTRELLEPRASPSPIPDGD
jgi:signal transduction histidine kinase